MRDRMRHFKLGDIVVIYDNTSGHMFDMGETVIIHELTSSIGEDGLPRYCAQSKFGGSAWYIGHDEARLYRKKSIKFYKTVLN